MNLIQWLEARRSEKGLSDFAFAALLGISHSTWSLLKRGERKPGLVVIKAARRTFPDYRLVIAEMGLCEIKDSAA